jgi:hypothetical protein
MNKSKNHAERDDARLKKHCDRPGRTEVVGAARLLHGPEGVADSGGATGGAGGAGAPLPPTRTPKPPWAP